MNVKMNVKTHVTSRSAMVSPGDMGTRAQMAWALYALLSV